MENKVKENAYRKNFPIGVRCSYAMGIEASLAAVAVSATRMDVFG
jgi:hypothetical protein